MLFSPSFMPTGIVHLGAHHLQELAQYNASHAEFVVWAEANPELHGWIRHRLNSIGGHTKHYLCDRAITDADHEHITFRIYNHTEASSIFDVGSELNIWYPDHKVAREVQVMTITVDTMLENFDIPVSMVNYLSIDIQGAELLALKGAQRLLNSPSLQYIQSEAINNDYYKGGVRGNDLVDYLAKYNFEVIESERHTATHPDVQRKISNKELTPVDQLNILFKRK